MQVKGPELDVKYNNVHDTKLRSFMSSKCPLIRRVGPFCLLTFKVSVGTAGLGRMAAGDRKSQRLVSIP